MTRTHTIAEQVATFQESIAGHAPAEVLDRFTEEQRELDARGTPAGIASAGDPLPDGELLDVHGEPTTLAAARAGGPAIVVFYRGSWCPYCNLTLRAYQQQVVPEATRRGVRVIAVSPQKPDGSLTVRETNELTFTVVSDPGNQVADQLGIVFRPGEGTRESQRALGIDVAAANADGSDAVPMPTVLIVDADGVIRWIDVHPNYTRRSEPAAILAALTTVLAG